MGSKKVDGRAQSSASTALPTEVATAREDAPRAIHEHTKGAAGDDDGQTGDQ